MIWPGLENTFHLRVPKRVLIELLTRATGTKSEEIASKCAKLSSEIEQTHTYKRIVGDMCLPLKVLVCMFERVLPHTVHDEI